MQAEYVALSSARKDLFPVVDVLGNIAGPPLSLISLDSAKIHVQKSTRITQALSRPRQDGTRSHDSPAPSTTHFSIIGFADNSALTVLARLNCSRLTPRNNRATCSPSLSNGHGFSIFAEYRSIRLLFQGEVWWFEYCVLHKCRVCSKQVD